MDIKMTVEEKVVLIAEKEKLIYDNYNIKVSIIYNIIPNHKIQSLYQSLGVWSHFFEEVLLTFQAKHLLATIIEAFLNGNATSLIGNK